MDGRKMRKFYKFLLYNLETERYGIVWARIRKKVNVERKTILQ